MSLFKLLDRVFERLLVSIIAFMAFLIYYGIRMTDYERGMFGETLTWISYAYVYVSIPIGAAVTILFTVSKYLIKETSGSSPVSSPSLQ